MFTNFWYNQNFDLNLISTFQYDKKEIEVWLKFIDQLPQFFNNATILKYSDTIDKHYILRLKKIIELFVIANSANDQINEILNQRTLNFKFIYGTFRQKESHQIQKSHFWNPVLQDDP